MTPIINPIWFYIIDVSGSLSIALIIIGGLLLAFGISAFVVELEDGCEIPKIIKRAILGGVTMIAVSILLPSEDACYKMMTASIVTSENIKTTGETATEIIDYIIEKVDELTD